MAQQTAVAFIIGILLQFVFFIPFYFIWRKDCKELGKDNLAVSLEERFIYWLIFCPIWICPLYRLY
jgi:hypothetical protein